MRRFIGPAVVLLLVAAFVSSYVTHERDERNDDKRARHAAALGILRAVDDAQWCWWERQHRYGANFEDLQQIVGGRIVGIAQEFDLDLGLHVASNRHAYALTITGDGTKVYIERRNGPRGLFDYGANADGRVGERCPAGQRKRGLTEVPDRSHG